MENFTAHSYDLPVVSHDCIKLWEIVILSPLEFSSGAFRKLGNLDQDFAQLIEKRHNKRLCLTREFIPPKKLGLPVSYLGQYVFD